MPASILHLTDLHLQADPAAEIKGVRTRETLIDVLQFINEGVHADRWSFDTLVVTGDLTHDERSETYEALRELLGESLSQCRLVPGNHDDRELIRRVFPEITPTEGASLNFSLDVDGWRLIGLDSHVTGELYGRIGTPQLEWLSRELTTHAAQPSVLFMHHPPVSIDSKWLDDIGLRDADALGEVVRTASQVQLICAGHVHQEYEGTLHGARVVTTPSTGVQFVPGTEELACDEVPPGFRIVHLDGGECRTEVVRLGQ